MDEITLDPTNDDYYGRLFRSKISGSLGGIVLDDSSDAGPQQWYEGSAEIAETAE